MSSELEIFFDRRLCVFDERINRTVNHLLNTERRFQNRGMKSLESGYSLDHFERDFGLNYVFSS